MIMFYYRKKIKQSILIMGTLILSSIQVFAYEAPMAIDQLRIDTYLMLRHLPKKISNKKIAAVLEFAVPNLFTSFYNDIDEKLSHRSRKQGVSPEIAVEAAFRALDLVLFGKQSKSKVFQSNSNFVINDQEWGFQDASEEDIDNGIPLLIAYALNLASVTIESYSDHKTENKARFKQKIDDAKDMMQATKDKDYKEHLDVALGVIKAELLYRKWRKDVIKEATKNRQSNIEKEENSGNYVGHYSGCDEWPDGKVCYLSDEEEARDVLRNAFWNTKEGGYGVFANVRWSDVNWEEDDYAYGIFEKYSDDSLVKDRLTAPIFHPKKNQIEDYEGRTDSGLKLRMNLGLAVNKGLAIEEYDRKNKFNSFLVPNFLTRFHGYLYSSLDMDFLEYIYMNYVNLHSILVSDYKKHNTGKFHFIPRLYRGSSLLEFLTVGSKLYPKSMSAKKFIDSFNLTGKDENELHNYFKHLAKNQDLEYELYCYTNNDKYKSLEYVHLSNQLSKKTNENNAFFDEAELQGVVANKLRIGIAAAEDSAEKAANIGADVLPKYFSTDTILNRQHTFLPTHGWTYHNPDISYYTDILSNKIWNSSTSSDNIVINARRFGGELDINLHDTLRLVLRIEEIEKQEIVTLLSQIFKSYDDAFRRIYMHDQYSDNSIYTIDDRTFTLISSDLADKISLQDINAIASKYNALKVDLELGFKNRYSFNISFKDQA